MGTLFNRVFLASNLQAKLLQSKQDVAVIEQGISEVVGIGQNLYQLHQPSLPISHMMSTSSLLRYCKHYRFALTHI